MNYYKIIFEIDTDDDFTFKGENILDEFTKNYKIALCRLRERLEQAYMTIDNKYIKFKLKIYEQILLINEVINSYTKNQKIQNLYFNCFCGNYNGDFGVECVEQIIVNKLENEIITYKKFFC